MRLSDRIAIHAEDGVADVRLSRPEKMNALDPAMFEALMAVPDALAGVEDLRCVVLSGEGRAFCAGLDMANFGAMASGERGSPTPGGGRLEKRTRGDFNDAQYACHLWRDLPVPVIAAVHGVAFGGGFQIMLGADIRLTAPDTKLSIMEVKWGLVPDMGGTQIMRLLARDDVIRELSFTGRVFSGEEAAAFGFATRTSSDPHGEAMALAREIAGKSPDAVRATKRILNAAPWRTMAEGMLDESVEQDRLIGAPNQIEAVMAALEKRPARFAPGR